MAGACSADGDDTAAAGTTTTTAATTATLPPLPGARCCTGVSVDPGRYLLPDRFAPLTSIDVPDGWTIVNEARGRYLAFGRGANVLGMPSQLVMLLAGPAAEHANLADDISSSPELGIRNDSTSTASGVTARQLDAVAHPNPGYAGSPGADIAAGTQRLTALGPLVAGGFGLTTSTPAARLRFVLRQHGEVLFVAVIEAPAPEFDAFSAAADELVAGVGDPDL